LNIAIVKEIADGEHRVSLDPDRVKRLVESGHTVLVESGAGDTSFFLDPAYVEAGAEIVPDAKTVYERADTLIRINAPTSDEIGMMSENTLLISFLYPLSNPETVQQLLAKKITSFSMDLVPRIARAQKMDALSSMSSIAGYKAVLIAADALGKYFPMLITAAGTIAPAKALVLGAGVAGLQAIATARRLGAVVSAYDIRPAVKEQVESLGGHFLEVDLGEDTEDEGGYAKALSEEAQQKGQEMIHEHVKGMDVVITTALIPGRPAPKLITEAMVKDMPPGAVIVDLAAESGGNCELTKPGETITIHDVIIHGPMNIPALMPVHASQLYARNVMALFEHLVPEGKLILDFEDEVTQESCLTHAGNIINERVKTAMSVENA
jgi:NAD(P) transhydrogenase subunit alpha